MKYEYLLQNRAIDKRKFNFSNFNLDTCEDTLELIVDTLSESLNKSISIHSFRSNLAKISIIRNKNYSVIMWDNRFFDIVDNAIKKAVYVSNDEISDNIINNHIADLYAHASIYWVVDNPYLASALLPISNSFRERVPEQNMTYNDQKGIHYRYMYKIINMFCLLHEIGHIADDEELDHYVLVNDVERIKNTYQDIIFQNISKIDRRPGEPDSEYVQLVHSLLNSDKIKKELRADIYAIKKVFEFESLTIEKRYVGKKEQDAAKLISSLLIYESFCLLHYVTSDIEFIVNFTNKSTKSLWEKKSNLGARKKMLMARGDIRIYLASIIAPTIFENEERGVNLISKLTGIAVPRYAKTFYQITTRSITQILQHNKDYFFRVEDDAQKDVTYQTATETVLNAIGWC